MSIAKCSRNVPFVLERLCDVDEAVRRAAFLYISAINVTQLRVKQRVLTLKVKLVKNAIIYYLCNAIIYYLCKVINK